VFVGVDPHGDVDPAVEFLNWGECLSLLVVIFFSAYFRVESPDEVEEAKGLKVFAVGARSVGLCGSRRERSPVRRMSAAYAESRPWRGRWRRASSEAGGGHEG